MTKLSSSASAPASDRAYQSTVFPINLLDFGAPYCIDDEARKDRAGWYDRTLHATDWKLAMKELAMLCLANGT